MERPQKTEWPSYPEGGRAIAFAVEWRAGAKDISAQGPAGGPRRKYQTQTLPPAHVPCLVWQSLPHQTITGPVPTQKARRCLGREGARASGKAEAQATPQARRGLRQESRKRPNGPPTPRGESHSFRGGEEGGSERHIRPTDPPAVRGENIKRKPSHRPTLYVWRGSPCPIRQSLGRSLPKRRANA